MAELGCSRSAKATCDGLAPATTGFGGMNQFWASGIHIGWLPMLSSRGWSM